MRVLYFGTYEREYPRNAQVISCLRRAGVEVVERHEPVWEDVEHKFALGGTRVARLLRAEVRLFRRPREHFDVVLVGYPGHADVAAARHVARGRPVVLNPLVSLYDTLAGDRARVRPGGAVARALLALDRYALRAADLVVADTQAHAVYLAALAGIAPDRVQVCLVGAEERLFAPGWQRPDEFACLFVGKLIPLHGLETILDAAREAPDLRFRVVGSGQLAGLLARAPENVEHVPWVQYEHLAGELHRAGCVLGIFGTTPKARRVIPNKAFQALACATPLVTGDTPAARELLVHGESALLVAPGDAGALADAVRSIATDASLAHHLSERGHAAYRAHASEDVLGARWRALLERVAA